MGDRSAKRRLERSLIPPYSARIDNLALAFYIASLALQVGGFGHVLLANLALARARKAELLHRLDSTTWPRPAGPPQAGQIRGVPVAVTAKRV